VLEIVPMSESAAELKDKVDEEPAASPASRRKLLSVGLRLLVVVAIAAGLVYGIASQWQDVEKAWLGLAWQSAALSVVAALAGMLANVMAWRSALRDLDHKVPFGAAARICMVGQLGKYIPGSVWAYVLQTELARRAGVPRARSFLATLAGVGLGVTVALTLGLASLPTLLSAAGAKDTTYGASVRVALIVGAVILPVALICAIPRVLTVLIQVFLRLVKKPPLNGRMTWPGVLRIMGWTAVGYTFFGIHLWLLANAQAAPGPAGLLRCIGAFALAMTVGMFAFVSPSGLGFREAVLVAALTPFLTNAGGYGAALGIAVASRLIFTIADLLGAGAAAVSALWQMRKANAANAAVGAVD
jgi:uncharacterized membrane protein YbhN (UPF0104 family)